MRYFVILLVLFSTNLFAQVNLDFSGIALQQNGSPASKAAIILFNIADSVAQSKIANENGTFLFSNVKDGEYFLTVSFAGFKQNKQKVLINAGNRKVKVTLEPKPKDLVEVGVKAKQNIVTISGDKKIYNVGQDLTAVGGSAADVLKNVPSLQVDPIDGNVAIRGNENITLLIDGRPSVIFGDDVATALQSIPAASIESVEVITNAGAAYDAQGKGGVLNIVLKKDRKAGYNGTANASIGLPYRANAGISLNANKKKWNVFTNVNVRNGFNYNTEITTRENFNDTTTYTTGRNTRRPKSMNGSIGAEYNFNKANKITVSQNFFGANMEGNNIIDLTNALQFGTQNYRNYQINTYEGRPRNTTTSINYLHTFVKPGAEIKFDGSMGFSRYRRNSEIVSDRFNQLNELIQDDIIQKIPVEGGNNNLTLSTDYTTPVGKLSKLDLGIKYINFDFRSENFPTIQFPGQPILEQTALKNKFNFQQLTYATYANWKQKFNEQWSGQFGARLEQFEYSGFVYQYNENVKGSFTNLFPSAFINYKPKENQEFNINYTRRTNRPNFFQLIPYIDVTNPQDTSIGNPNLVPEFINAMELGYTTRLFKKHNLNTSIYYQYNENLISRYRRFNPNGTTFSQQRNLNSGTTYGAEVSMKLNLSKVWDATINGNVFYNSINGANLDINLRNNGWSGFGKVISNYKLLNKYDIQVAANYNGRAPIAQGYAKGFWNTDIALKRNYFKNMLTVTLTGSDIFNTIRQTSVFEVANSYYQESYRKPMSRQIVLGAQLRFISKNTKPSEIKDRRSGRKAPEKEVKSRDENLKKDEKGDDDNGGGQPK